MTTPEQQAPIDALISHLDDAATHVKALIAERDALKAELAAINGAGEPVAWIVRKVDWSERMSDVIRGSNPPAWADVAHPLYTRPAVPLTDERVKELVLGTVYQGDATTQHRDAWAQEIGIPFARAIEAAHNIKGA